MRAYIHICKHTCPLPFLRACRPLLQCPSDVQERDFRGGPCNHSPLPHQKTYTHSFTALCVCLHSPVTPNHTHTHLGTHVHYYVCELAGLFCSARPMCKNATSEEAPALIPPCLTNQHTHTHSLHFLRACRPLLQCPSDVQERDFRGGPCNHSPLPHQETYTHSFTSICECLHSPATPKHTHTWGHMFTTMFACLQASFAVPVPCARTRLQRRPLPSLPPATPSNIHTHGNTPSLLLICACSLLSLLPHQNTHTHTHSGTHVHYYVCVFAGLFRSARPMCKNATSEEAPAFMVVPTPPEDQKPQQLGTSSAQQTQVQVGVDRTST